MLTDEDIDYAEQNYDRLDARKTKALLDEIARLRALVDAAESNARLHFDAAEEMRAENEKLRAARLRPETVEMMRAILADIGDWDAAIAVLRDLNRCYPPEEE